MAAKVGFFLGKRKGDSQVGWARHDDLGRKVTSFKAAQAI